MRTSARCTLAALTAALVIMAAGCDGNATPAATPAPEPAVIQPVETTPAVTPSAPLVTASDWEQKAHGGFADFPPQMAIDGNLKTSWRAEGDGQWIQLDVGRIRTATAVKVAFVGGDKRKYTFDILTSRTGSDDDWQVAAEKIASGGTTLEPELFDIEPVELRYVRLVGHGNTNPQFANWFNITELEVLTK